MVDSRRTTKLTTIRVPPSLSLSRLGAREVSFFSFLFFPIVSPHLFLSPFRSWSWSILRSFLMRKKTSATWHTQERKGKAFWFWGVVFILFVFRGGGKGAKDEGGRGEGNEAGFNHSIVPFLIFFLSCRSSFGGFDSLYSILQEYHTKPVHGKHPISRSSFGH